MTSPEPNFDWIPIYKELADKFLLYKNDHHELYVILSEIFEDLEMRNPFLEDGNIFYDVCPFTVFASFNRGLTEKNRMKIISELKNKFSTSLIFRESLLRSE